jgi:hypothetical protein
MRIVFGVIALIAVVVCDRSTKANVFSWLDIGPPASSADISLILSDHTKSTGTRLAQNLVVDA